MDLITPQQQELLLENGGVENVELLLDRPPLVKLFTPDAAGTWLISAIDPADYDRAWGLCDPGLGSPELGWLSLAELASVRGRLGIPVRQDYAFLPDKSLREYMVDAENVGIIVA